MVLLMVTFTEGNLLEAPTEALVNTVNEVGVMGKGIALMFRDAYPKNNAVYEQACKRREVRVGHMLVSSNEAHWGPRWIINFPTKRHWRNPSRIEWVEAGLSDLTECIRRLNIKSIAIPPLGCGNGGLDWNVVKDLIASRMESLESVDVRVYVPTATYQNSPKKAVVRKLTPARAMIAEMIRRYGVLGFECSMIEVQKLAWFLERGLRVGRLDDPLKLRFSAGKYGPYADALRHVLEGLDGAFLRSQKRIADAKPHDVITFDEEKSAELDQYLSQVQMRKYADALAWAQQMIQGFESPFGMELLATVDWLLELEGSGPTLESVRTRVSTWPHSTEAALRKASIFDDRVLTIAIDRVISSRKFAGAQKLLNL